MLSYLFYKYDTSTLAQTVHCDMAPLVFSRDYPSDKTDNDGFWQHFDAFDRLLLNFNNSNVRSLSTLAAPSVVAFPTTLFSMSQNSKKYDVGVLGNLFHNTPLVDQNLTTQTIKTTVYIYIDRGETRWII